MCNELKVFDPLLHELRLKTQDEATAGAQASAGASKTSPSKTEIFKLRCEILFDDIFDSCNIAVETTTILVHGIPTTWCEGMVVPPPRQNTKAKPRQNDDNANRLANMAQWLDLLLNVAMRRLDAQGKVGGASFAMKLMLEECMEAFKKVQEEELFGDKYVTDMLKEPVVIKELENWQAKLRKLHKQRCLKGPDGEGTTAQGKPSSMGPDTFLRVISDARLIGSGLSYAKVLEAFVASNHDELSNYLGDMVGTNNFLDEMLLEYPEFEEACVRCMACQIKKPTQSAKMTATKLSEMLFMVSGAIKR